MFYSDKVYNQEKVGVSMKPSIYGLTQTELTDWLVNQGEKSLEQHKFGIGCIKNGY